MINEVSFITFLFYMAKVYSWSLGGGNYGYIVNPTNTNEAYVGSELTGGNLDIVKTWAQNCSDTEYETHFNKLVRLCQDRGLDVEFENVEAYLNVSTTCDNLRGPAGKGIRTIRKMPSTSVTESVYAIYYDDDTYDTFTVTNGRDGAPGAPGEKGAPGDAGISSRTVIVYASGANGIPSRPEGGSWDYLSGKVVYPNGWSASDELEPPIFMSSRTFASNDASTDKEWSAPRQITGENGKPGEDGVSSEFIYLRQNAKPDTTGLASKNEAGFCPDPWTPSPQGVDENDQREYVAIRRKEGNVWGPWSDATIWSQYGVNGQDGDGVQYIYLRTKLGMKPKNPTPFNYKELEAYQNKDNEWIPEIGVYQNIKGEEIVITESNMWTDDPVDVDSTNQFQWMCQRKYRKDNSGKHVWLEFSEPTLWAKYGQDGSNGTSVRTMYAKTSSTSQAPDFNKKDSINPGNGWGTGFPVDYQSDRDVVWGISAVLYAGSNEFVDPELGWEGPFLVTGVKGQDSAPLNYTTIAFAYGYADIIPPPPPVDVSATADILGTVIDKGGRTIQWQDYPDGNKSDNDERRWYQSTGYVDGSNQTVSKWSSVVPCSGKDGKSIEGKYFEYRFLVTKDTTEPKVTYIDSSGEIMRHPYSNIDGVDIPWATTESEIGKLEVGGAFWQIWAKIDGETEKVVVDKNTSIAWNGPVRISGEKGDTGEQGPQGPAGLRGVTGLPGATLNPMYCLGTEEKPFGNEKWKNRCKKEELQISDKAKHLGPWTSSPLDSGVIEISASATNFTEYATNDNVGRFLGQTIVTTTTVNGTTTTSATRKYLYVYAAGEPPILVKETNKPDTDKLIPYVWCTQGNDVWKAESAAEGQQGDTVQHTLLGVDWCNPFRLQGVNGLQGIAGNRGQVVYPMGVYSANEVYRTTLDKAPYVYDPNDAMFYVLNVVDKPWVGKLPTDYKTIMVHPDDAVIENTFDSVNKPSNVKLSDKKYVRYQGNYYTWDETNKKYEMVSFYKYSADGSGAENMWLADQNGDTPANNYANNTNENKEPAWVRFESFQAFYTNIGIIANGMIGSAVYNNEFMFSQQGFDKNGARTDYAAISSKPFDSGFLSGYEYIDGGKEIVVGEGVNEKKVMVYWKYRGVDQYIYDEDVNPYKKNEKGEYIHDFMPNVCINFKTGEMWTSGGKTNFDADGSGYLADGQVLWTSGGTSGVTFIIGDMSAEKPEGIAVSNGKVTIGQLDNFKEVYADEYKQHGDKITENKNSIEATQKQLAKDVETINEALAEEAKKREAAVETINNNITSTTQTINNSITSLSNSTDATVSALTKTISDNQTNLQSQIDKKAETFYQEADPSTGWKDSDKPNHEGDMWFKTSTQITYRYNKSGTTYAWQQQDVPVAIFDKIDGKSAIFVSMPLTDDDNDGLAYHKNDLWLLEKDYTGTTAGSGATQGSLWVAVNSGVTSTASSFVWSNWVKKGTELDNWIKSDFATKLQTITNSIDKKAETYYSDVKPCQKYGWQNNDSATTSTYAKEKLGDMWYDSINSKSYTYADTKPKDGIGYINSNVSGYYWVESNIPQSVFDKIDGKATIYTTKPTPPYFAKDLLIPTTAFTVGTITYEKDEIYRCTTTTTGGTFSASHWVKATKYTDDTAAEEQKNRLTAWADDNKISPIELEGLKDELTTIKKEYSEFSSLVSTFGKTGATEWTNYKTWYDRAKLSLEYYTGKTKDSDDCIAIENTGTGTTNVYFGNIAQYYQVKPALQNALVVWSEARATAAATAYTDTQIKSISGATNTIKETLEKTIQGVETAQDGKSEMHAVNYDPSSAWTATTIADSHIGDFWYNTSGGSTQYFTKTKPTASGATYTTAKCKAGTYYWVRTDLAVEVFDYSDGKSTLFVGTSPTGYTVNDMWIIPSGQTTNLPPDATTGDTVVCKSISKYKTINTETKTATEYTASDWVKLNKYTDDSFAEKKFNAWAEDGYISPVERQALKSEAEAIAYESGATLTQSFVASSDTAYLNYAKRAILAYNTAIYYSTAPSDKTESKKITTGKTDVSKVGISGSGTGITLTYTSGLSKASEEVKYDNIAAYYEARAALETAVSNAVYSKNASELGKLGTKIDEINNLTGQQIKTITGTTSTLVNDVKNLGGDLDKKAELFSQNTDPSTSWTTSSVADTHLGDIWYNTASGSTQYFSKFKPSDSTKYSSAVRADSTQYYWVRTDLALEVFDYSDGKSTIYFDVSPTGYTVNDMWIIPKTGVLVELPDDTKNGDTVICTKITNQGTKNGKTTYAKTYNKSDWSKLDRYTDDTFAKEKFDSWGADGSISPIERLSIKNEGEAIAAESGQTLSAFTTTSGSTSADEYVAYAKRALLAKLACDYYSNPANAISNGKADTGGTISVTTGVTPVSAVTLNGVTGLTYKSGYSKSSEEKKYGNIAAYYEARQELFKASIAKTTANINATAKEFTDWKNGTYATTIKELQEQSDKKSEIFYGNEDPAVKYGWQTTDSGKTYSYAANHVGDLWMKVNQDRYIYVGSGTNYGWRYDESIPISLFDKMDGKSQIFVNKPVPPYHIGDLWIPESGSTIPSGFEANEIYRCQKDNVSSSLDDSNFPEYWVKASKYTDDTAATQAKNRLTGWGADQYINPQEQNALKDEWVLINDEYEAVAALADVLGMKGYDIWTNYVNAYTNAKDTIKYYTNNNNKIIVSTSPYYQCINIPSVCYNSGSTLVTGVTGSTVTANKGNPYYDNIAYYYVVSREMQDAITEEQGRQILTSAETNTKQLIRGVTGTTQSTVEKARDDIAKSIGYASYEAMTGTTAGTIVTSGGYLNAQILDTEHLIAGTIDTKPTGGDTDYSGRIQVSGNTINVYRQTGNKPVLKITGSEINVDNSELGSKTITTTPTGRKNTISNYFGASSAATTTITAYEIDLTEENGFDAGETYKVTYDYSKNSGTTNTMGNIQAKFWISGITTTGTIEVYLDATSVMNTNFNGGIFEDIRPGVITGGTSGGSSGGMIAKLVFGTFDITNNKGGKFYMKDFLGSSATTKTILPVNGTFSGGASYKRIYGISFSHKNGSKVFDNSGTIAFGIEYITTSFKHEVENASNLLHIGNNGFILQTTANNYIDFSNNENNSSYTINCNKNAIQINDENISFKLSDVWYDMKTSGNTLTFTKRSE